MPPKRPPVKPGTTSSNRGAAVKGKPPSKPTTTTGKKNTPAAKKTTAPTKPVVKKGPSPEDLAAIKIQKYVRRFLAKAQLNNLKKKKAEYDDIIEKLQKEAFVAMVKAEQEAAEREYKKEEEERKRKRAEALRKKRMLEAAFDGDIEEMLCVLKEVDELDTENGVSRDDDVGRVIRRSHQMAVVDCEDANGNTPISDAAGGGSAEAIKFLVERGANPNTVGAWGRTPLYRAAFGGHLEAVESLLQYGADPRIRAEDSNSPAEAGSVQAIIDVLENWDISYTEKMLDKMEAEKERKIQEDQMRKEIETNKLENEMNELKKDYEKMQLVLQRAYAELEKRITEHDHCVNEGSDLASVTLQSVHDAEGELEIAKLHSEQARTKLEQARLVLREKQHEGEETLPGINCNIRELDEVLMRDVGNKIKDSGKWPLLIDPTGQATTFLRYRDTNYACALNPKHMEPEVIRMAILGAIRFGKPYVLDMLDVDMMESCENVFNIIQPNLFKDIMTKEILQNERYMELVRSEDDDTYQKSKFQHHRAEKFMLVIITKNKYPSEEMIESMYPLRIVLPGT